jgi:tRNA U55 pseudouridine synthase TruB
LAVAELPRLVLPDSERKRLEQGQVLAMTESLPGIEKSKEMAVFDAAGRLAAVAVFDRQRQMLQPLKVLHRS